MSLPEFSEHFMVEENEVSVEKRQKMNNGGSFLNLSNYCFQRYLQKNSN